ncbi:MAG: hypothetical protein HQ402_02185, partial [Parcubacteria group bacterium]|nr:hypothetical protein [Parcubacteria group bacterium]
GFTHAQNIVLNCFLNIKLYWDFIFSRKTKKSFVHGFTLVETLVAISILIVAITTMLGIAAKGLSNSIFAKEQITAFYLAQDAIEYIKNQRDNTGLLAWNDGGNYWTPFHDSLISQCSSTSGCGIDTRKSSIGAAVTSCVVGLDNCILRQDSVKGLYGYDPGWALTPFTRVVNIGGTNNDDELKVSVTISWSKGAFSKSFVVTEYILNWQ